MPSTMSPTNGLTRGLASLVTKTGWKDLPKEVVERTKSCLLDWIGSAFAGRGSPTDRIIERFIHEHRGRRGATLIGSGFSASPMEAALFNGMISAVAEIDDVHEEASLHAGIGVIPAALAVAEEIRSSGWELIVSIVVGYELSVRLARATGTSHYHFWHTTGTCNTFGAAAAAGKLLRLEEEQMAMALGLAGTQAAGLWEGLNTKATMAKHLHSGKAAANGLLSAFLARQGFRGAERIIEGEKGFLISSSKATAKDIEQLGEGWGRPFLIMKNFFKRYACCRGCFEGIEGIQTLRNEQRVHLDEIEEIRVVMKPDRTWLVGNLDPTDIYEAKFSLPFCMALKAIKGEVGVFAFHEGYLRDPEIRDFMKRIKLFSDPEIHAKARLEVVLKDGTERVLEPRCQSLTLEEVEEKFLQNLTPLLGKRRTEDILKAVGQLDQMETIQELTWTLKSKLSDSSGGRRVSVPQRIFGSSTLLSHRQGRSI